MKRILAFVLILIMLMSTACSKPKDDEVASSIDENVQAENTDNKVDPENQPQNDNDNDETTKEDQPEQNQDKTPVTDNNQQQENVNKNESYTNEQQNKPETPAPEQQPEDEKYEPIYDDSNATPASSFEYKIDKDKNSVSLIKFIGNEKDVVIPNYIEGYPVRSLSMVFCSADSSIESVIIPKNMEILHEQAFYGCKNLKTVITKSENLVIKNSVFENCSSLNNLTLGEGVVEVGAFAFRHCTSLRNIHIPSTLNKYGTGAFGGITIEKLTFTDGIETIGSSSCFVPAYGERTENSFKTVIIPASVKTIATYSFGENLQEITFLGNAPEFVGEEEWLPENVVVKYKKGTTGWDDPKWEGYNLWETE